MACLISSGLETFTAPSENSNSNFEPQPKIQGNQGELDSVTQYKTLVWYLSALFNQDSQLQASPSVKWLHQLFPIMLMCSRRKLPVLSTAARVVLISTWWKCGEADLNHFCAWAVLSPCFSKQQPRYSRWSLSILCCCSSPFVGMS